MAKIDRRIRRTRAALAQALFVLILQKPYETITIQDITDQADLNRATFYLHYSSKEELLMASLEGQFDALVTRLQEEIVELPWQTPTAACIVFEYAAENEALFRTLLGKNGQGYVMYRILEYIARYDEALLQDVFKEETLAIPLPILARQFAGSLFSLLVWWLENGRPYPPLEMAKMLKQLCTQGVHSVFPHGLGAATAVGEANYYIEPPTSQPQPKRTG